MLRVAVLLSFLGLSMSSSKIQQSLMPQAGNVSATSQGVCAGSISINVNGNQQNWNLALPYNQYTIKTWGNGFTMTHGARAYLVDKCSDKIEPSLFENKLKFLGKTFEYSVDMSSVSCGCNAALYMVQMPAYGSDNNYNPSTSGDYYCDANKVSGIYCPEMDTMEANRAAFQVTPHKCNEPNGHSYSWCDGGGCAVSTRWTANSYGPGNWYTIDTTKPYTVKSTYGAENYQLTSVHTVLSQEGRSIELWNSRDGCGSGYLESMSKAMDDMVVTVSFWGDSGSTMSWLDVPPCSAWDNCNTGGWVNIYDLKVY